MYVVVESDAVEAAKNPPFRVLCLLFNLVIADWISGPIYIIAIKFSFVLNWRNSIDWAGEIGQWLPL